MSHSNGYINGMNLMRIIGATLLCNFMITCGIFTPRDGLEQPEIKINIGDPFSFSTLLEGSGQQFSKLNWYELFHDDFTYTNTRLVGEPSDKTSFIDHLEGQYDQFPEATVAWDGMEFFSTSDDDTFILNDVTYKIVNADTSFDSGSSNFIIIRDSTSIWQILRWTDLPFTTKYFFSPSD